MLICKFNNEIYDCSEQGRLANLITDLEQRGILYRTIEMEGDKALLKFFNMFGEDIGSSHNIKNVFKNLKRYVEIL